MTEWKTHTVAFECKKCKTDYKASVDYQLEEGVDLDIHAMNMGMLNNLKMNRTKCIKCKGTRSYSWATHCERCGKNYE